MKILLPVIGVRGDVQVFFALAKALENEGHEVTVAVNSKFQKLGESYAISCYALVDNPEDGVNELQEIMKAKNTMEAAKIGTNFFFKGVREQTKTLQELCPLYDVIIGYGSFGLAEADKANKTFISVVIDPTMAEKKFSKNMRLNMGLMVEKIALYFLIGKKYEQFRKEIGAPPSSKSNNPQLILLPMSQHVVKPSDNWTSKNVISGYWYLEVPSSYFPPEDLQKFIENGEKPIFISFGSAGWSEEDNISLLKILFEAVRITGSRAIILNTKKYAGKIPDHIYLVHEIPFDWLFGYCSCVVHHCGLGTTAEVLKAGLPSIPVPYMIDQFAWAERIHSLGVATRPIPRKELTADKLSKAIVEALDNHLIRENAVKLGHKTREEDGLKSAVRAIESATNTNGK
ncbi:glycosyltransferase family 1 protein [Methanobacterium sp. CWC-01]|uniref:glycosyltransferase n=1 Tax=Methanobacterium aridiramus TaxID=2584467 RepID=UPI0025788C91|nr:glycosyltransferase [Methanobacterium sp. CWC-01]WJI09907.1 glycosyltransferase family 1 protein [Methanobacterium sp. CWC-01]